MSFSRRFLVAPSLFRLLNRDLGADPVIEGYFANQPGRSSLVRLAGDTGTLVLLTEADGGAEEERTDIPRAHAEALLDVAPGRLAFARIGLVRLGLEIFLDRFIEPGPLSLATVVCADRDAIGRFQPPSWFGEEVTGVPAYHHLHMAFEGAPPARDVSLTNGALHDCLDMLEDGGDAGDEPRPDEPSEASETVDALLRFAGAFSASPPSEEKPAPQPSAPAPQPPTESPPRPASRRSPAPSEAPVTEDDSMDDSIRALAWSLRPQSSRKKDKRRG